MTWRYSPSTRTILDLGGRVVARDVSPADAVAILQADDLAEGVAQLVEDVPDLWKLYTGDLDTLLTAADARLTARASAPTMQ